VEVTVKGETDFHSECGFIDSFRRRLHPSRWKRILMCLTVDEHSVACRENDLCPTSSRLTSVSRQNDDENNNGQSASNNMNSNRHSLFDFVFDLGCVSGRGHLIDKFRKNFILSRISRNCSMTYLANFYCAVCGVRCIW